MQNKMYSFRKLFNLKNILAGLLTASIVCTFSQQSLAASYVNSVTVSATQSGPLTYGSGNFVTYTVTLNSSGTGTGSTSLTLVNWTPPTGVTAVFSQANPVGLPNGGMVGQTLTLTITSSNITPAGTATFNVRATGNGQDFFISNQASFVVNPKGLSITANNQSNIYGSGQSTPVVGSIAFSTPDLVNGNTIGSVTLNYGAGAIAPTDPAGSTSTITPSAATGGTFNPNNYSITYNTGLLTVTPAPLTITADDVNKEYGTTITGGAGSNAFSASGLQNGETITVTITYGTGANATDNAGTYSSQVIPSDATGGFFIATNYNISYINGTIFVDEAILTYEADPASRVYGAANPPFTGTVTGFVNGEDINSATTGTLTFTSTATATTGIGFYPILGSGLSATNYVFVQSSGNATALEITLADLTITANDQTKCFGDLFIFNGTEFSTNGLLNADNVSSVTLSSTGAPSGATVGGSPYDIQPSAAIGTGLGNYSITYVNGSLTVRPLPSASISGGTTICEGNSTDIFFTGTPGATVTYNIDGGANTQIVLDGNGDASVNTGAIISDKTYNLVNVFYSSSPSCLQSLSESATVIVNPNTVITLQPIGLTLCAGSNADFVINATGTAPLTYQWQDNSGGPFADISGETSPTLSLLSITTAMNGRQYLCRVTGGCSVAESNIATLNVDANTVGGSVGPDNDACFGNNSGSVNLGGQVGSVLNWEFSTNGGASYSNIVNLTTSQDYLNLTQTTLYRAVVKSGVCPQLESAPATITVNPNPNVSNFNSTSAVNVCAGSASTVTVNSSSLGDGIFTVSYDLSGANIASGNSASLTISGGTGTFNTPALANAGATNITVTSITNGFVCNTAISVNNTASITVNPNPDLSNFSVSTANICSGNELSVSINSNSLGNGTFDFSYNITGATTSLGNNISVPVSSNAGNFDTQILTNSGSTTVTIISVTNVFNCVSNPTGGNSVSATVHALPTALMSGGGSICQNQEAPISIVLTGASPWNMVYTDGSNPVAISGIISSPYATLVSPLVDATYTVSSLTDGNGCIASSLTGSAAIVVSSALPPTITLNAGSPTDFCFTGSVILTASEPNNVLWSNGETTQSITVSAVSGVYTVTYTHPVSGCTNSSAPISVDVKVAPEAKVEIISGALPLCPGDTLELSAASSDAGMGTITGYQWHNSSGPISGETSPTLIVTIPDEYWVVVTNSEGCTSIVCP